KFGADRLKARDVVTDFETKFSVGSYLAYQGNRFGERFDANSYSSLTMAMDLFNLGETREKRVETLARSQCRWLLVSYTSDWLFPPFQSRQLVDALIASDKRVSYCNIKSSCGHDAFLLPNELSIYGGLLRGFLENLYEEAEESGEVAPNELRARYHSPTSIFHDPSRIDYDSIVELIPEGASVLDLGCGNGGLLDQLRARSKDQQPLHERLMGVEWDEQTVLSCVERGFDVVQSDLNEGLAAFNDRQFDVVVLSQTLQTVTDVERIIDEMLRVGERGIVSFPNLAYHAYCEELIERGRAPRIDADHGIEWHNTPNVRFLSIADFMAFCESRGIQIHDRIWLDTEQGKKVEESPNRNANLAILVISK
ncbi:MAG: methionine biosynthesis protein MetW, partial [Planctomycetia bacterium]